MNAVESRETKPARFYWAGRALAAVGLVLSMRLRTWPAKASSHDAPALGSGHSAMSDHN